MVEQNVMTAQLLKQVCRFGGEAEFARNEGLEFEFGMRGLLVDIEQARQIDGAVDGKNLPGIDFEINPQALDDVGLGVGFNFQAYGVAFAAIMKLGAD